MYIKDGSSIDYDAKKEIDGRFSFGWLENEIPDENKGWPDTKLRQKVLEQIHNHKDDIVIFHFGMHECSICPSKNGMGEWNGSYIITFNNISFRCPTAIIHYIETHDYRPPDDAIEAILNGKWMANELKGDF